MLGTNNQAHQAYTKEHPEEDDPPYLKVSSDVAIQTAKPKVVEEVMNLQVGNVEGNRESSLVTHGTAIIHPPSLTQPAVSALMVALDMIHVHKHTKSWALEVMLLTDGERRAHGEFLSEAMWPEEQYERETSDLVSTWLLIRS